MRIRVILFFIFSFICKTNLVSGALVKEIKERNSDLIISANAVIQNKLIKASEQPYIFNIFKLNKFKLKEDDLLVLVEFNNYTAIYFYNGAEKLENFKPENRFFRIDDHHYGYIPLKFILKSDPKAGYILNDELLYLSIKNDGLRKTNTRIFLKLEMNKEQTFSDFFKCIRKAFYESCENNDENDSKCVVS